MIVTGKSTGRIVTVLGAVFFFCSTPADAAEISDAEIAFVEGVRLFSADRYIDALASFERSFELVPRAATLFNMAMCNKALMRNSEAAMQFERFLDDFHGEPAMRADAAAALDELLRLVGLVEVSGLKPGAEVSINRKPIGVAPLEAPLVLNPGVYRFTADLEGYRTVSMSISVTAGARSRVWAEMRPLPKSLEKPSPPVVTISEAAPIVERRRPFRASACAFGGTGLAAAGAGIYFSVMYERNREAGNRASESYGDTWDEEYVTRYNDAVEKMDMDKIAAAVGYGLGGTLLLGSLVLWAVDHHAKSKFEAEKRPVALRPSGILWRF